ncbi:MAG: 50S ribosomal protein L15 [Candidatus Latescibacteria bacterium]|jgi:large subunit ribosomal protein L15|nr:50S ribosomal protein L15 [Candidatus Latescibacterota bacterium]
MRDEVKLNELKIPEKAKSKSTKRLGRGSATGQGCTAGRGHKGQNSRSGGGVRRGFEGGQMPIIRRLPKRGFFNKFRTCYEIVNLSDIADKSLKGEITLEVLLSNGLVRKSDSRVKILGDGKISEALNIKAHAFSRSAREKIESAGGTAEVV